MLVERAYRPIKCCIVLMLNPGSASQESILANAQAGRDDSFSEMLQGFYHAIDWSEPWLIALLVGHVLTLLVRSFARLVQKRERVRQPPGMRSRRCGTLQQR